MQADNQNVNFVADSSPYGYSPSTQTPPQEEPPLNNILLYTIFNPIYPITVVREPVLAQSL